MRRINGAIFLAWFTFTPANAAHPREQHWFTAEGHCYAIDPWALQGVFPIERVIPGSDNVCQQPAENGTQSVDINPGMDGGWHDPSISGQGFLFDAHADAQSGKFLFLAWLTYGEGGGQYDVDAYETPGGSFVDPQAAATRWIGQMTIDFNDCTSGGLSYTLINIG